MATSVVILLLISGWALVSIVATLVNRTIDVRAPARGVRNIPTPAPTRDETAIEIERRDRFTRVI
jgi:hypothetical protein